MTELLANFFARDFTNIMGSVFSNELGGHDGGMGCRDLRVVPAATGDGRQERDGCVARVVDL